MATKKSPKYKKFKVDGSAGEIALYASPRILSAVTELLEATDLYGGVKLGQIIEAVYAQGKKDGRRETFDGLSKKIADLSREFPHKLPGRPKNKSK